MDLLFTLVIKKWIGIVFLLQFHLLTAQNSQINLVPNYSFEEFDRTPIGWFYNGTHFTKLVKFWSSPTEASPDAYGPDIFVPGHWQEKGFGKLKSFDGSAMAGITVYGCNSGKAHCREYLQIQLSEPIIPGQKYRFSLHVASLPGSVLVNNLGLALTRETIKSHIDSCLNLTPIVYSGKIFPDIRNVWQELSFEFTGKEDYGNIIIGNFSNDRETLIEKKESNLNFGYYYIDNVILIKLPPLLPQPIKKNDLTLKGFKKGEVIALEEIYFDVDQVELHPRSLMELDKLFSVLIKYPDMKIKVTGHTDNSGSSEYNMELSLRRAEEVIKYLKSKGVNNNRLFSEGKGDSDPLLSNRDYKGRSKNRRVEFEVLSL